MMLLVEFGLKLGIFFFLGGETGQELEQPESFCSSCIQNSQQCYLVGNLFFNSGQCLWAEKWENWAYCTLCTMCDV